MERLFCNDWRDASAATVAALYAPEIARWSTLLDWDTSHDWTEVERARQSGIVPGVLVTDDRGAVTGWAYYFIHDCTLQIGTFVSSSEACTTLMMDTILGGETRGAVDAVTFMALTDAAGLVPALKRHGLSVSRYWYLSRDLNAAPSTIAPRDARQWRREDAAATAELFLRAYKASQDARPFAPRGTPEQWHHYVTQLVAARGCGAFMGDASLCVSAGPGRLAAVSLVSRISADSGHLVQLAVDPQFQRRGLGAMLLEAACASAARAGCRRLTLLVSGGNTRARGLYEGARFVARANLVAAVGLQPRRSTSVAPGASVATRR